MTTTTNDQKPGGVLRDRLRTETRSAHLALETHLGFEHRPSRALATAMLLGFHEVLEAIEPALARLIPGHIAGREKLELLRRNLGMLGLSTSASRSVRHDRWIPQSPAEAMGALYVLEGSTLGGKVIAKALRRVPDWPLVGETYFDPYGASTGTRWLEFLSSLETIPDTSHDEVVFGANRTFQAMNAAMHVQMARMNTEKVAM